MTFESDRSILAEIIGLCLLVIHSYLIYNSNMIIFLTIILNTYINEIILDINANENQSIYQSISLSIYLINLFFYLSI